MIMLKSRATLNCVQCQGRFCANLPYWRPEQCIFRGKGGSVAWQSQRKKKSEILDGYLKILANAKGFIVTEYRGFSMKNFNATRAELRKIDGRYAVTKNTIFKRALVKLASPRRMICSLDQPPSLSRSLI
ncbi:MAG: 50S ribosomal protein L10 [Anaerolineae bacterium]